MAGSEVKIYTTMVMDGSNVTVVNKIMRFIERATRESGGIIACRDLDSDYSSIVVIDTVTDAEVYNALQHLIELRYPGLCVFNPNIAI